MAPFHRPRTTFYWSAIATLFHHKYGMVVEKQAINKTQKNTLNYTIALYYTVFELFDVE